MSHNELKYYSAGIHNVGSYQASGWPWLTASVFTGVADTEIKTSFPMVTKSITFIQSGSNAGARIHFVSTSSGPVVERRHYVSLNADGESLTMNVKCKEVYISVPGADSFAIEIQAELTNIPTSRMYTLTGSGHTE